MANDTRANQLSQGRKKKPYRTPKVRAHGNVRDITKGTQVGTTKTDNPLNPKNKTGLG